VHVGKATVQSLFMLHATQTSVPALLQTGVSKRQAALSVDVHWTQAFVVVSHTVAPRAVQFVSAVHATQAPVVLLHAGVVVSPAQSVSAVQAVHFSVVVSQTGVVPVQALLLSAVQATHACVVVSHAGVAPEHCASAMHGRQAPSPSQTVPLLSVHVVPLVANVVPQQLVVQFARTHFDVGTGHEPTSVQDWARPQPASATASA